MWELFVVIVLGIVQGASEFLPISSSGHLVVFYNIFNITDNTILLSVMLHVATLIAVGVCYRKQLLCLIKNPFCQTNLKLLVATIPTVLIAFLLKNFVEDSFDGDFVITGFLITALVLLLSQNIQNKTKLQSDKYFLSQSATFVESDIANIKISYMQALLIGIAQGVAIFPGISRSGSTIAMGLVLGVRKNDSADFSFLLSIPVILGSMLLEVIELVKGNVSLNFGMGSLIVGLLVAFVSGLFSIKLMLKFVKNKKLTWFSVYLFLLSVFLILNKFVLGWF